MCDGKLNYRESAVHLENVSFSYGESLILDNVNLTTKQGDFVAIVGPNGGGKTTLLRLMLGFLPPRQGTVCIFGKPPRDMRRHIGYVPQFATLQADFPSSVLEMVLMGAAGANAWGKFWPTNAKSRQRAGELLEVLGLGAYINSPINALSGGQRQRALMARALMGRPQNREEPFLLLLDEPTANIDPEGKYCFYDYLNTLRDSLTILVVSHDLLLATPYFSSTILINKTLTVLPEGKLTLEGMTRLFGAHPHACPMGDLQHEAGTCNMDGCTHTVCLEHCEKTDARTV